MKKFKQIYLEISPKCNLSCKFCPYSNTKTSGSFWDDKILEDVLIKTKDYTDSYYLHVLGEPLLNPNLSNILDIISKYNKTAKITTNGTLLNKTKDILLKNNSLSQINISFESWIEFNNDKIDSLILDIVNFIKDKELLNKKLTIELRFWNNKKDNKVIEFNNYIINKFKEYDIDLLEKHIRPYLTTSYHDEFRWPCLSDSINNNLNMCLGGISQLGILNNGKVVLCCLDHLGSTYLGNIFNNNLDDILNNKEYLEFKKLRNNNKCYFELCSKCTFRDRFIK